MKRSLRSLAGGKTNLLKTISATTTPYERTIKLSALIYTILRQAGISTITFEHVVTSKSFDCIDSCTCDINSKIGHSFQVFSYQSKLPGKHNEIKSSIACIFGLKIVTASNAQSLLTNLSNYFSKPISYEEILYELDNNLFEFW